MTGEQISDLGDLFEEVQMKAVFPDGKTFPDCMPRKNLATIKTEFETNRHKAGFNLSEFVHANFVEPPSLAEFKSDAGKSPVEHINQLWDFLTRQPQKDEGSLIALPNPYIVPGGRFREIYYWDSYFTMLGLRVSGRLDMIRNMVDNFSFLIDRFGYIPNGNRTYFLGRSQPPFFSLMVALLQEEAGDNELVRYLPYLEKEYSYWMRGEHNLKEDGQSLNRVVRVYGGALMNRYWDENETPRPEAYREDVELSHAAKFPPAVLYRHLRAAAESGWDFSSRWFAEDGSFESIHTTDIIPIDLNCLLVHLEHKLAEGHRLSGDPTKAVYYKSKADQRTAAIQDFCWDDLEKFYFDYDYLTERRTPHFTLAAAFPLFFKIADKEQALEVATILSAGFLKPGGLATTLNDTGQQWDAPNGWAPLQWIAFQGLLNYGIQKLAMDIRGRWMNTNERVYQQSGKMTEKYDVHNENAEASGGEYPNQDGFGWTNGVYLAMSEL